MPSMAKRKKKPARKPDLSNPWPARLKAIRVRLDITQSEAAARLGTVLRTWQNWEYGRTRPNPMLARLIDLTFPD